MRRIAFIWLILACVTVNVAQAQEVSAGAQAPRRVVSLDFCADQFVLALADRAQIAGLSTKVGGKFSYLAAEAHGLPQVRDSAEDVIKIKPDLVVRSFGGGFGVTRFFERTGVPVAQLNFSEDFAGVRANIRTIALALGHPERGDAMIARFDARLAAAARPASGLSVLYMTPGGVTSGAGSLVHEVARLVGLRNYGGDGPGWHPLPLERIAQSPPSIVAAAFFDDKSSQADAWSATRHPVARRLLQERDVVHISGASTACNGWFIADAAEALAAKRDALLRGGQ